MKLFFSEEGNTEFHEHISGINYYFFLEEHKWSFTENLHDAKVVPISVYNLINNPSLATKLKKDQIALLWIAETAGQNAIPSYYREIVKNSLFYKKHNKILVAQTNHLDTNDPLFLCHDIMFNRHKLYCTSYNTKYNLNNKMWVNRASNKNTYAISPVSKKPFNDNKVFLCPIRLQNKGTDSLVGLESFQAVKLRLHEFMKTLDCPMYMSDTIKGHYLYPNDWSDSYMLSNNININQSGNWYPAGDIYYQTSYISIGIENVYDCAFGDIFYPTEKSFDPLIKGNFPLLFSGPNHIKRLSEIYGFKFPKWIDYSYDSIDLLKGRFDAFLSSIKSLSKIPLKKLHELYLKDKHILEHNQNVFFERPYSSLYDQVDSSIKTLGW